MINEGKREMMLELNKIAKGGRDMFKKIKSIGLVVLCLCFSVTQAFAELNAVGPVNPQNGFPTWYQDGNGLTIELGLDPLLNLFDPPIEGNPFSQQIGFGAEGFYWIVETAMDIAPSGALPGGGGAFYRAALEYAFANEDPADGDQFVFGRLRFRVDIPVAGTYIITHPYGVDVFDVETPGIRALNVTIDVGSVTPDFAAALSSRVGPFLTAVSPPAPAGFIGAGPLILSTVTGSPFGTNFLRIEGPSGSNLGGPGVDFVETDLFTLSGKIFTGSTGTPLTVPRASYGRINPGDVDVFATSTPGASVTVNGLTPLPAPMTGDGTGKFFRRIHLADSDLLPPVVTVTADNPPVNTPTSIIKELVDAVTITKAEYDVNSRILTIEADSSDDVVNPALTAVGFGDLVSGVLNVANVLVPPPSVTVTSARGGEDTHTVQIVAIAPPPENVPPAAANDNVFAVTNTPLIINVVGNDTDIDGTVNPTTVAIVTGPVSGGVVNNGNGTVTYTSNPGFSGVDSFTYTVQDDLGATSNVGTVDVTVSPPAPNVPPVAVDDGASTDANTAVIINVAGNDTDIDGAVVPASVAIVTPPPAAQGAVVNNGNGTVTFTPAAGFSGQSVFTYTVQDNLGATSNVAAVTVTVTVPEVLSISRAIFRTSTAEWILRGTDSLVGATITVSLNRTGQTIGTAVVDAFGNWRLIVRGSPVVAQAGDSITARSSNGASASLPVTIL